MADVDPKLDPYTLRAMAREQDERGIAWRRACHCAIHAALAGQADEIAAQLRTLAIQVEQATAGSSS